MKKRKFKNNMPYSSIEKEQYIVELQNLSYYIGKFCQIYENCRYLISSKDIQMSTEDKEMLEKIMNNSDKVSDILVQAREIMNEAGIIIPKYGIETKEY